MQADCIGYSAVTCFHIRRKHRSFVSLKNTVEHKMNLFLEMHMDLYNMQLHNMVHRTAQSAPSTMRSKVRLAVLVGARCVHRDEASAYA